MWELSEASEGTRYIFQPTVRTKGYTPSLDTEPEWTNPDIRNSRRIIGVCVNVNGKVLCSFGFTHREVPERDRVQ